MLCLRNRVKVVHMSNIHYEIQLLERPTTIHITIISITVK
jgi:hypothetical protein